MKIKKMLATALFVLFANPTMADASVPRSRGGRDAITAQGRREDPPPARKEST